MYKFIVKLQSVTKVPNHTIYDSDLGISVL